MTLSEIEQVQIKWHSQAKQGCIYATSLMKNNFPEVKLKRYCIDDNLSVELVQKIAFISTRQINNQDNNIVSFILPKITDKDNLLLFIDLCKSYTNWQIDDSDIYDSQYLVRMRIPFNEKDDFGNTIYAWVIGFAPLDFLPITRQSPFFEIMFVTKSKGYFKNMFNKYSLTKHSQDAQDRGGEAYDAHLADIYIKGITDTTKKDRLLWEQSQKKKLHLHKKSGQEKYEIAKAKVTFSYPL